MEVRVCSLRTHSKCEPSSCQRRRGGFAQLPSFVSWPCAPDRPTMVRAGSEPATARRLDPSCVCDGQGWWGRGTDGARDIRDPAIISALLLALPHSPHHLPFPNRTGGRMPLPFHFILPRFLSSTDSVDNGRARCDTGDRARASGRDPRKTLLNCYRRGLLFYQMEN